jgi:hypothetical protein
MLKAILSSLILARTMWSSWTWRQDWNIWAEGLPGAWINLSCDRAGARSIQTYTKVKELAADLGIHQVRVVAIKVRSAEDEEYIRSRIPEEDLLGIIHYNAEVIDADRRGVSPYDMSPEAVEEFRADKTPYGNE